jgi:hypothetical protein
LKDMLVDSSVHSRIWNQSDLFGIWKQYYKGLSWQSQVMDLQYHCPHTTERMPTATRWLSYFVTLYRINRKTLGRLWFERHVGRFICGCSRDCWSNGVWKAVQRRLALRQQLERKILQKTLVYNQKWRNCNQSKRGYKIHLCMQQGLLIKWCVESSSTVLWGR